MTDKLSDPSVQQIYVGFCRVLDVPVARRLGRRLMPHQLGYRVKQIYVGY